MSLTVDQGRFCGLSSNRAWQDWLRTTDEPLYHDLMKTRSSSRGCNANKEKMKQIYAALYERGKGAILERFIRERFAYLIVGESPKTIPVTTIKKSPPLIKPQVKVWAPTNASNLNKHNVFESYRPNLLTFPRKMIFVNGNRGHLEAIVKHFLKDKISTDYIIVEDRAYVEYFDSQYQTEADKVPRDMRDLHKYRLKHMGNS